jgi:hypothetical protein
MEEEFDTHGSLMCVCESRTACAYRLGTWLLLDDFVQFLAGFMEGILTAVPPYVSASQRLLSGSFCPRKKQ